MAPLPENSTVRVWLDYTSLGRVHSFLFRLGVDALRFEAENMADLFANALTSRMSAGDAITGARWSETGSLISLPIDFTPRNGAVSGALTTWDEDPESTFLTIPFRGAVTGRKGFYSLFSPIRVTSWPADNRWGPGEVPVIDTFRLNITNIAEGLAPGSIGAVSIGGDGVRVKNYVNLSKNGYWERKQRRSG